MSTNRVYKFTDINALQYFLNGAVFGSDIPSQSGGASGWDGLVGKTLILAAPSGTVTFTAGAGPGGRLLFKDLKQQVEAVIPTALVTTLGGKLIIVEVTPSAGVTVDKDGTANSILGFDSAKDSAGKIYTPPGVTAGTAQWTWAYSSNENVHVVYTWE